MKITIEAERANLAQKTGVEHYAKELIVALSQIDHENQYNLLLRTPPQDWFFSLPSNFSHQVLPFPVAWTQLRISYEMLRHQPDRLFIPASSLPIIHPCGSVVTVHDVAWRSYPESFTRGMRNFLEYSTWHATRAASRIIAVSEQTKVDLIKYFHIDPEIVSVVHHGYTPNSAQANDVSAEFLAKLPEHYFLFVSTIQPRKNLPFLIQAMAQLRREYPELPHKLVIAGKPGWEAGESMAAIQQHSDFVTYLGHVSNAERDILYQKATAFVHPSLYEGFGMWILEAFDACTPVVVANTSCLPEIAGDAALYFDPHDIDELKQQLFKVTQNEALRHQLIAAGRVRLQHFSWARCASETLAVIQSA